MTIVKWKTSGTEFIQAVIQRVEVLRETEQSIYVTGYNGKERREGKETGYAAYHDTWEAAHAYLTLRASTKVAVARNELQRRQDLAGNIKGLKKPGGA
jgi:hypothetical protein